jgi:hypothetical protein
MVVLFSPSTKRGTVFNQTPLFSCSLSDNDNRIRGGGRETSVARFSPTIFMIIIIVLFCEQAYYTIIVQGRGCFETDKIIFLTSNSIWFAFSHIAFSLNSSYNSIRGFNGQLGIRF